MAKPKNPQKSAKNPLDRFSTKRGRGRPFKVVRSAVAGRSSNYRDLLPRIWNELEGPLLAAKTPEDVVKAFEAAHRGSNEFPPQAQLILEVIRDPQFPKTQKARINFLADSVAGVGLAYRADHATSALRKGSQRAGKTGPLHHPVRVLRTFLRL